MLNRLQALLILQQCSGDEIWSFDTCRAAGVPEAWIDKLGDCFESGFRSDFQTIYVGDQATNQYEGVRAVDLARQLGEHLGVDVPALESMAPSRRALVEAIKEAADEG